MKRLVFEQLGRNLGNLTLIDGGTYWLPIDLFRRMFGEPHPSGQTVIEVEARVLPQPLPPVSEAQMELLIQNIRAVTRDDGVNIRIARQMRDELTERREREGKP